MSVTLKDIAKETGLSVATVSKYINGATLKERNRAAIEQAIQRLGYTVNELARGLKSNKSRTIGVIIPELSNLFITQIITKIEDILRGHGYSVVICDCHTDEKLECEAVRFLLGKMVDGIINMPVCKDGRHLLPAVEKGIPVTLIDRPVSQLSDTADCVLIDNEDAAYRATKYLMEHGHKHIGIITGPGDIYTSVRRLAGYRKALSEAGLNGFENLVAYGDYTVQGGYESMSSLLSVKNGMTAVFVTNYEMTLGAMIAANERNVRIPQELSFLGFDNMDLARVTHPKLSIVTQPLEEMGIRAANLMLERLTGGNNGVPACIMLPVSLQLGDSVISLIEQPILN